MTTALTPSPSKLRLPRGSQLTRETSNHVIVSTFVKKQNISGRRKPNPGQGPADPRLRRNKHSFVHVYKYGWVNNKITLKVKIWSVSMVIWQFIHTVCMCVDMHIHGRTFTSDVSLWQFLQALDTEEKVRSAWSNFPPWKFRKNVVKGSWE